MKVAIKMRTSFRHPVSKKEIAGVASELVANSLRPLGIFAIN